MGGRRRGDNAMVKAVARAFQSQKPLESETYGTVGEIVEAEKINVSFVGQILRLTLLAPEIVGTILDRRQPAEVALMNPFPVAWVSNYKPFLSRNDDRCDRI